MSVAGANMRGAARIIAVGTRPVCVEAAKKYGAGEFLSYKNGPIDQQVLNMTGGKGVDKIIIAGGGTETFAEALMPGGRLRMEKLSALVSAKKLDVAPLSTHVFEGWDHLEEALFLMKDKPADLIKPVVKIQD